MKRLFLFVVAVSVAVAALTSRSLLTSSAFSENAAVSQAGNAAFRDGLHLGKFDAQSGRSRHLSVGRWSSEANRDWFIAGYHAGYQQVNPAKSTGE
jgi:hypothetical protein